LWNFLAKTFTNQIWSLKMLIAQQTETKSLAKPGPSALDLESLGGERRSGRGRYGTKRRGTETRRGGVKEKCRELQEVCEVSNR
jgi:hypothetical protein